ncbi:hypothetical protein [Rugosimonospora africana]|uniref:Uncharacterized protein n=1 Tax=Rugosimonospora africana TaxID=556532 RepID=A0A8J3QYZ9_9ACTN|nr:hypothetical protein [Rugosimonospora africana]GIH18662.1 hypothetical protein Raf01_68340 [Rugosimonospora africana]
MSTRGDGEGWAGRYRAVRDALDAVPPVRAEVVEALRLIPALREELDGVERAVIDAARRSGVSWTEVASALGLRSRQAAEQRRLRLGSGAGRDAAEARQQRRRQRSVDAAAGAQAVALRAAVEDLLTVLDRETPAPAQRPAFGLARRTLRIALDADPGALVDLARLAAEDLEPMVRAEAGNRAVGDAVGRVRELAVLAP